MTCNITEGLNRTTVGTSLLVLLLAFSTANADINERDRGRHDGRSTYVDEDDSGPSDESNVSDESDESDESDVSNESNESNEASAQADNRTDADGNIQVATSKPDADPLIESGKAIANATFSYADDAKASTQDALVSTASNDTSAAADATVESDESVESNEESTQANSSTKAEGNIQVASNRPDAKPLIESGKATATRTLSYADEVSTEAKDAVSSSVSNDIAASVDAAVKEDVRANIQEDVKSELEQSLPLPGQD